MKKPILLIAFNRPEKTKIVFQEIKKYKPEEFYFAVDGPRDLSTDDIQKCEDVKKIADMIDWDCEIHTLFQKENLGVDPGMETAISWFFDNVEDGIILEDDCLPQQSFFKFSEILLDKYKNDPKVFMICGTNFQDGENRGTGSYYFSNYPTWGYAMWKRSWKNFDSKLNSFPVFKKNKEIHLVLQDVKQIRFWMKFFEKIYNKKFNFTDSRITYSMWKNKSVCIIPNKNLIKNIGFDADSTHAEKKDGDRLSINTESLINIKHPEKISIDRDADDYFFYKIHNINIIKKIFYKIKQIFK